MKYFTLTILLVLFSFASCKKKELDFKFSGNIKDSNSGLNVPNATIKYYTYTLGNNVEALKGEAQTDALGNYEVTIERSKFETLKIKVTKENYFKVDESYSIDDLTTENSNDINYSLSPKSWTKFVLKNGMPASAGDELKIQKVSGKIDCDECCANETTYYNGVVDTIVICPNDGGKSMKIFWWVNGNDMNGEEVINNIPFDTTTVTIAY
jgi:hypothetical protein